jgi:hypothetical protein
MYCGIYYYYYYYYYYYTNVIYFILFILYNTRYRDFWKHPVDNWNAHPDQLLDYVMELFLSFAVICGMMYNIDAQMHHLRPNQWIYATFKIYVDAVVILMTTWRSVSLQFSTASHAVNTLNQPLLNKQAAKIIT